MSFNLKNIRLKIMFYSIFGKIGNNFSKIEIPNKNNIKKVIIFFPIDDDSFRVSLYSFRKFNFYNTNVNYYFIISQQFQNLINLNGPNIIYVNYNKNKIRWCDMKDKDNILNQIDPSRVSHSFCMYVVSQLPEDDIMYHLEDYREHFKEIVLQKLKGDVPVNTYDDEIVNQHKENEITQELQTACDSNMNQLHMWLDQMKLRKKDWKDIFEAIS